MEHAQIYSQETCSPKKLTQLISVECILFLEPEIFDLNKVCLAKFKGKLIFFF